MVSGQAKTPRGKLAPLEKTKAVAFQKVIEAMENHLGKSCWQQTGQGQADFTAGHLRAQGGGRPSGRAIKKIWAHQAEMDGATSAKQRGRPPEITQGQRQAIAKTAMGLKKRLMAPTPEKVRISMPRKTINKKTKQPISDKSMQGIFKAHCYDEDENDLWHYRNAVQQDCLTERAPLKIRSRTFSSAGLRFSGFPNTPKNWISNFFPGRFPVVRFPEHP